MAIASFGVGMCWPVADARLVSRIDFVHDVSMCLCVRSLCL